MFESKTIKHSSIVLLSLLMTLTLAGCQQHTKTAQPTKTHESARQIAADKYYQPLVNDVKYQLKEHAHFTHGYDVNAPVKNTHAPYIAVVHIIGHNNPYKEARQAEVAVGKAMQYPAAQKFNYIEVMLDQGFKNKRFGWIQFNAYDRLKFNRKSLTELAHTPNLTQANINQMAISHLVVPRGGNIIDDGGTVYQLHHAAKKA